MIIYRLSAEQYKDDLSGTGAKLYGGRWNITGMPVLYTTENISLAVLEILVRTTIDLIPLNYHLIRIDVPDNLKITIINSNKLKKVWKNDVSYTQWIGNEFIKSNEGIILKVPSAIVEEENNYILNPSHSDYKKIKIASTKKFSFDKRLYLKSE